MVRKSGNCVLCDEEVAVVTFEPCKHEVCCKGESDSNVSMSNRQMWFSF